MSHAPLAGHGVLVVEDQWLIALDLADSLRAAGATVLTASTLRDGLRLAETSGLSAAVINFDLHTENTAALCEHLTHRRVPFVLYTGHQNLPEACRAGIHVHKPGSVDSLIRTLAGMIGPSVASDT